MEVQEDVRQFRHPSVIGRTQPKSASLAVRGCLEWVAMSSYAALAALVVFAHLVFVVFATLGGMLALRAPEMARLRRLVSR